MTNAVQAPPDLPEELEAFRKLWSPAPLIAVVFVIIAAPLAWVVLFVPEVSASLNTSWPALDWFKLMFLGYSALLGATWTVYFLSGSAFPVRSLRRLLMMTSLQWDSSAHLGEHNAKLDEQYQKKSEATITALAVLTAVAVLEIVQFLERWNELTSGGEPLGGWNQAVFALGGFFALTAFICFLLSIDSLDSIFNFFRNERLNALLDHSFYARVRTPKYAGFAALLLGLVFMLATYHLKFACVAYGMLFVALYGHLFPKIDRQGNPGRSSPLPFLLFLAPPVIMLFL